jgi:hypothetical protein
MRKFVFDGLVAFLREEYGTDLRWVANYNSKTYEYEFRHVRDDLRDDLTGVQLDHVVHRSIAVYNKRHAEDVYFHLGEANYLVTDYERGTAFHVFLDDVRGVTILLEPHVSVTVPEFVDACRNEIHLA